MPPITTLGPCPSAVSRVIAAQTLSSRRAPGTSSSLGAASLVWDGRDRSGKLKARSLFETVGLQNNGAAAIAKVRPQGGAGVTQFVELLRQLRATRIALAHNIGGPTAASADMILKGPRTNGS